MARQQQFIKFDPSQVGFLRNFGQFADATLASQRQLQERDLGLRQQQLGAAFQKLGLFDSGAARTAQANLLRDLNLQHGASRNQLFASLLGQRQGELGRLRGNFESDRAFGESQRRFGEEMGLRNAAFNQRQFEFGVNLRNQQEQFERAMAEQKKRDKEGAFSNIFGGLARGGFGLLGAGTDSIAASLLGLGDR